MPGRFSSRYSTFGLLYFSQGAVLSYFTALNAIYLLSFNLTMSQIGLFSAIAVIPMILKVFVGMLSDRVSLFGMGHRKPYIVAGLLLQTTGILIFPYIHPMHSFPLLILTGFVTMSGMALYDTCTDGLALDTTPRADEGKIQGIMVSGRASGVVVIAGLLGVVSTHTHWNWVFYVLAAMSIVPLPFVLRMIEPARKPDHTFNWKAFRILTHRHIIALGLFGFLFTLITNGSNELVNPFLKDSFNISYMAAGFYTALWGAGVIAGGLTGGWLTDRIGDRKALLGAVGIGFISVSLLAAVSGPAWAWPLIFLFGIAYGYYETAYFATSMSVTDIRIAASMFSILMAMANIGSSAGMVISAVLSDRIGFRMTFLILGIVNLLLLALVPGIFSLRGKNS